MNHISNAKVHLKVRSGNVNIQLLMGRLNTVQHWSYILQLNKTRFSNLFLSFFIFGGGVGG